MIRIDKVVELNSLLIIITTTPTTKHTVANIPLELYILCQRTHTHGYLNIYLCEDLDSIEVGDKQGGGGEEKRREIRTIAPCIVNVNE